MFQAVEAYVHIDGNGLLRIKTQVPLKEGDVKVIIMYGQDEEMAEEQLWLKSISNNPAFTFLNEPEEDIYSLKDGKPLDD